ncbi:hypothetical protein ACU4GD_37675 [Cupriavidus basilensis]
MPDRRDAIARSWAVLSARAILARAAAAVASARRNTWCAPR